jgi:P27 family predicted phage terminase small subunit
MGKRGPKPKDKAGKTPLKGSPKPPKGLDAESRKHWQKLAKLLDDSGFGSALDADAFEYYVALHARWRKAEDELAKPAPEIPGNEGGGEVITTVNRYRQLNPWYVVARDCLKDLKSYLAEFGLSPKARMTLIQAEAEEVDSKWEEFDDEA